MHKRFVDREDVDALINKHPDFIVRYHDKITKSVAYAFIISMVCIIIFAQLFYEDKITVPSFIDLQYADIYVIIGGITFILGMLSFYIYTVVVKTRYVVMILEFQNLMFSSAAKTNAQFCMIANEDEKIVYFDNKADEIFSEHELKHVRSLIQNSGLTKASQAKFLDALTARKAIDVPFTYKDTHKKSHKIRMVMDIMDRPNGFVVIRGFKSVK